MVVGEGNKNKPVHRHVLGNAGIFHSNLYRLVSEKPKIIAKVTAGFSPRVTKKSLIPCPRFIMLETSHDATEPHSQKMRSWIHTQQITREDQPPNVHG